MTAHRVSRSENAKFAKFGKYAAGSCHVGAATMAGTWPILNDQGTGVWNELE